MQWILRSQHSISIKLNFILIVLYCHYFLWHCGWLHIWYCAIKSNLHYQSSTPLDDYDCLVLGGIIHFKCDLMNFSYLKNTVEPQNNEQCKERRENITTRTKILYTDPWFVTNSRQILSRKKPSIRDYFWNVRRIRITLSKYPRKKFRL